jgi:biotin transport system substrate-specific component
MTHLALPAPRGRVLGDVIPGDRVRDIALILAGAALTALGAQISIETAASPVPITGQTLAVVVAGAALGANRGMLSQLLYVAAGLVLPIYSDGASGWHVISGATGGYLVGFIVAAWLTGFLAERRWDRRFSSAVSAMLSGNVVIYLIGLPWLAIVLDTSLEKTLELGLYPFVAGDVLKLYLAGALLPTAWRIVERS